jgi:hypothetical protein
MEILTSCNKGLNKAQAMAQRAVLPRVQLYVENKASLVDEAITHLPTTSSQVGGWCVAMSCSLLSRHVCLMPSELTRSACRSQSWPALQGAHKRAQFVAYVCVRGYLHEHYQYLTFALRSADLLKHTHWICVLFALQRARRQTQPYRHADTEIHRLKHAHSSLALQACGLCCSFVRSCGRTCC